MRLARDETPWPYELPAGAAERAKDLQALRRDAERYRWLREQIKSPQARVAAQAMLWNNDSRTELDAAIDAARRVAPLVSASEE